MRHRLLVAAVVALVFSYSFARAQDKTEETKLQPKSRVYLIRGLLAEMAVARKTLPRGKEGLLIKPDGQVDERALGVQIANIGPAVRPGEVAQITKMDFRKDSIVLDINGGGVQKKKWYERIEVSGNMGATVTPDQQAEQRAGSQVTILFGRPVPDLTVEEVKTLLAQVLDFSQRSASLVFTDTWPVEIQEAVKKHEITAGMTRDQVLASKGRPENKIRERKGHVDQETWMYGHVPDKVLMVVFEGDEVVEARQFIPGIASTRVPREGDPPAPDAPVVPKPPQP